MSDLEFQRRIEDVKRHAYGHWTQILQRCGVDEKVLNRRNQPCPMCGGEDRFQYTDKFGEGDYHCRGCGHGGGFKLLQGALGLSFGDALKGVEACVGISPRMPMKRANEPDAERMKKLAKAIWDQAKPIAHGDAVDGYLRGRGLALEVYPHTLRCHPALGYYIREDGKSKSRKIAEYPAMLACVQGADGRAITLHRTYLQDGRKADVPDAKKLLSAGINGASVRLFEPGEELGIAEGIETALAVHLSTRKPVWSALNAGNLEKLWLPPTLRRICIYADSDSGFAGQAAAYAFARRLKKEENKAGPRSVQVYVPKQPGTDWADVWAARLARQVKAA